MGDKLEEIKKHPESPLNQDLIRSFKAALAAHDPNDVPDLPTLDLDDPDFDTLAVSLDKPDKPTD
jgi:hypothetical protein